MDEATDSNKDCLFISYARFVTSESLSEDLLFCKYVQSRATADELFRLLDSYLTEHGLKWENCVCLHGWCTDHGREKEGTAGTNQEGLTKCSMDTLCYSQRSASIKANKTPESTPVLHTL